MRDKKDKKDKKDKNQGLIIEGFVQGSYSRMFDNNIEVISHIFAESGWVEDSVVRFYRTTATEDKF